MDIPETGRSIGAGVEYQGRKQQAQHTSHTKAKSLLPVPLYELQAAAVLSLHCHSATRHPKVTEIFVLTSESLGSSSDVRPSEPAKNR